tara:strand:- start:1158 stop:1664 length:507 start_codon:yes stop_codon:yes gene_type:complete
MIPPQGKFIATAILFARLLAPLSRNAAGDGNYHSVSDICKDMIAGFESAMRLPADILQAILLAESGRWDKAEGVRSIDVGCMQVNLIKHPKAFEKLDQTPDPEANAQYSAKPFSKLRRANGSISRAIVHYHSTTSEKKYRAYTPKVIKLWNPQHCPLYAEQRQKKLAT